ncbi:AmmeMemoRadiSam system radical SAM enzyme [Candidatus Micrarchaeota archaeon RBG_16_36_9]|nr:MAG: AmmeMemoRadiSam system radical SAM enzyme [Candidatus Micrarchaeota archaeon RBG_16_36_9]
MKEAMFYKNLKDSIKCELCSRGCFISEGQTGFCRVRKNVKGKLYSLVYGKMISVNVDPIEKKPLYMFAPGSHTLSISSLGCNFRCSFCCNYGISQEWVNISGEDYSPEQIIDLAKSYNVQGFSYTYVEPTIFYEFSHDTAKLASENGFYNMWVTNGFTTPEAIKKISKYLNATVVDIKGSANARFYKEFSQVPKVEPIYDALLSYKKNNVYTEITDLIIPKIGDNLEDVKNLCKWISENLGDETPFHILQFFPTYKIKDLPRTPVEIMEKAYEIAKKEGLKYVYLGNVIDHKLENTYCPKCGKLVIERTILGVQKFMLKRDLKCPKCGERILIFGGKWIPKNLWK